LHKIEKKALFDDLHKKTNELFEFKREFSAKSEFLYSQVT